MNYAGKKVAVTGWSGFIGKALCERLEALGAQVFKLEGDVREPATFSRIDHTFSYLFHFGAPSSQVLFKRQPLHCAQVTVQGFINAAKVCRVNGVKLIYPSTGLLSSPHQNEYARCKKICEDIHLGENLDALGLRIFATYGPGEGHKRDYASVPYLFARDMVAGKRPVIFGDGNQKRDLVYIDTTVEAICVLAEEASEKIIDVGSGNSVTFNEIVEAINGYLEKKIEPLYVPSPAGYVQETSARISELRMYLDDWHIEHWEDGIGHLVTHLLDKKQK